MAQKVNPIAVRLRFNRSSESSWFSDYYYSTLLYQDLNFRDYLSSLRQPNANKLGFRLGKCIIHHYPKRSLIHLFCLGRKSPENLQNLVIKQKNLDRPLVDTFSKGAKHQLNKRSNRSSTSIESSDQGAMHALQINGPELKNETAFDRDTDPKRSTTKFYGEVSWSSVSSNKKKKSSCFNYTPKLQVF